ncbi:hypothetical protein PENTCL1PPCAC_11989, partial [Pristionchus entomophagus]
MSQWHDRSIMNVFVQIVHAVIAVDNLTMAAVPPLKVFEGAAVKYQKKTAPTPTSSRPARIVVTPGKIEVISTENKFPSIHIKPSDLLHRPKRPMGKTVSWISLDFIQHVDAKYQYINIQVDVSKVDDLVDILLHAWTAPKSKAGNSLFNDNADEIMRPVHKVPPNAVSRSTNPSERPARSGAMKIKVDEEGSAVPAHGSFNNDFNRQSILMTKNPGKNQTALHLQGMFSDYGITDGMGSAPSAPPLPVHNKVAPKKNFNTSSYAAQANKHNKSYRPVDLMADKTIERRTGLSETSFYGNDKPSQAPVPKNYSVNAPLLSTKDSLDGGHFGGSRSSVTMTRGTLQQSSMEEQRPRAGSDDGNENVMPSREKSFVSTSIRSREEPKRPRKASDMLECMSPPFGNGASSLSNNTQVVGRSSSMMDREKRGETRVGGSYGWNGWSGYTMDKYSNRKQTNIGNSCYMNSTMQMLASCPIFVSHLYRANSSLTNKSETMRRFNGLMRWLTGEIGSGPVKHDFLYKMRDCMRVLDKVFDENDGTAQQDAEECLTTLLGAISDECTGKGFRKRDSSSRRSIGGVSPIKTPIKKIQESDSMEEESSEKEGEKMKKMPAECDPVDLMEVKIRDVKRCKACGDTNEKPAMEHRVHLSMEEEREGQACVVKSLQQLLAAEVANEEIIGDFKCEKCGKTTEAIGTKYFFGFGEYIIIVFKRFGYNELTQTFRKLNTPIRVPMFLDMADFIQGEKNVPERLPLDETITISDERKSRRKKIKNTDETSPTVRVSDKTKEWLEREKEEKKEQARIEVLSQQLHDSVELVEEKKEKEEKMEEEEEEEEKTE